MVKKYILARLGELSTWKGILSIICGLGLVTMTDAQADVVATAMIAVYAAISAFLPNNVSTEKS